MCLAVNQDLTVTGAGLMKEPVLCMESELARALRGMLLAFFTSVTKYLMQTK